MRCKGGNDRYAGDTGSSRSDVNSHADDGMRSLGSRDGEER
jgi:hypothetical protein